MFTNSLFFLKHIQRNFEILGKNGNHFCKRRQTSPYSSSIIFQLNLHRNFELVSTQKWINVAKEIIRYKILVIIKKMFWTGKDWKKGEKRRHHAKNVERFLLVAVAVAVGTGNFFYLTSCFYVTHGDTFFL